MVKKPENSIALSQQGVNLPDQAPGPSPKNTISPGSYAFHNPTSNNPQRCETYTCPGDIVCGLIPSY